MIIGTDLKRSASDLKPTVSAATNFLWWNVSMSCMTPNANDNRYWFEEVCFEPETNCFCSNHSLMVRCLNVVHDSQNLTSSVLIWKGLLWIWNQLFLQQPFYACETSHTTNTYDDRYRYLFAEICFESETNGFCNDRFLIVKRSNVVHDSRSIG